MSLEMTLDMLEQIRGMHFDLQLFAEIAKYDDEQNQQELDRIVTRYFQYNLDKLI